VGTKGKIMYKEILQSIDGIAIYPIISFLIFFFFFLGLIAYVVVVKKDYIQSMKEMPLQNENGFAQPLDLRS
jgi:amino acid permease